MGQTKTQSIQSVCVVNNSMCGGVEGNDCPTDSLCPVCECHPLYLRLIQSPLSTAGQFSLCIDAAQTALKVW